jgi:iron complex outermembrane receptor protein
VNRLTNLHYTGQFEWGELEARLFHQNLRHHMDMIQDRFGGMFMPMDTTATTDGGMFTGSIDLSDVDLLRLGGDFQKYRLDDWWPPIGAGGSMCCNDYWNIRDGKRDRVGIFAEWEARWNPAWLSLLGIRLGTVESDAGQVQGYNSAGMYSLNATRFNAKDHLRKDRHLDLTALARHTPDGMQTYEFGVARKTRSPNLYERYPWSFETMTSAMNNFVGDGNAYIGNLDLKPEIAHTLSASADWHDATKEKWSLKLTGYVTHVHDFIDAKRCAPGMSASPAQCTAANTTTTIQYVKLVYENQAARLYGLDISGQRLLGRIDGIGSFTVTGMLSYVRGGNLTTGDNLYHIMPLNTKLGLVHRLGGWTNTVDIQNVEAKTRISRVRNEVETPGYTVVNFNTSYEWKHARLDVGVENLFNKFYLLPLGGAYLGQGDSMSLNGIPWGMSVPGKGRSVNVALNLSF